MRPGVVLREITLIVNQQSRRRHCLPMVKKNLLKSPGRLCLNLYAKPVVRNCRDEFIVIKGAGKPLLGKSTAEKLKVLHVGPLYGAQVCSIATKGSDSDIRTYIS